MQTKICNLSILQLSENENSVNMFTETLHNLEYLFFEKDMILEKNKVEAIQSHTLPQNLRGRKKLEIIRVSLPLMAKLHLT